MIKNALETINKLKVVRSGFRVHRRRGDTPAEAYHAMRQSYVLTNGRFNDWVSRYISYKHPAKKIEGSSSIIADTEIPDAVNAIEKDGYYIFKSSLPDEVLGSLVEYGKNQPCRVLVSKDSNAVNFALSDEKFPYDPNIESPKFSFDAIDLVSNPTIQMLLMDVGFRRVAQAFLRSDPILDLVAMWWSQPSGGMAHSSAAQLYHFDMDRLKFVKFFFYLTDVDTDTGPHCYIRGSSKRKPKQVLRDGRINDDEIMEAYSEEQYTEICGPAGTIIAVDTRGFHKGKPLLQRNRLLLQIEMTNSMFGATYAPVPFDPSWPEDFTDFVRNDPRFVGIIQQPE